MPKRAPPRNPGKPQKPKTTPFNPGMFKDSAKKEILVISFDPFKDLDDATALVTLQHLLLDALKRGLEIHFITVNEIVAHPDGSIPQHAAPGMAPMRATLLAKWVKDAFPKDYQKQIHIIAGELNSTYQAEAYEDEMKEQAAFQRVLDDTKDEHAARQAFIKEPRRHFSNVGNYQKEVVPNLEQLLPRICSDTDKGINDLAAALHDVWTALILAHRIYEHMEIDNEFTAILNRFVQDLNLEMHELGLIEVEDKKGGRQYAATMLESSSLAHLPHLPYSAEIPQAFVQALREPQAVTVTPDKKAIFDARSERQVGALSITPPKPRAQIASMYELLERALGQLCEVVHKQTQQAEADSHERKGRAIRLS